VKTGNRAVSRSHHRRLTGLPLNPGECEDTYSVKVHVWVGTSHIAGKGLFAAQLIKKGTP